MEEKYAVAGDGRNRFKQNNTLITIWNTVDPVSVLTKGELNAFPSWPTIDRALRLDTQQNGATGLD
jgi:hypothetical protein